MTDILSCLPPGVQRGNSAARETRVLGSIDRALKCRALRPGEYRRRPLLQLFSFAIAIFFNASLHAVQSTAGAITARRRSIRSTTLIWTIEEYAATGWKLPIALAFEVMTAILATASAAVVQDAYPKASKPAVGQVGFAQLWSFGSTDLDRPLTNPSALIEASDGELYGATFDGGSASLGTIFRVRKDGTGYEILRSFTDIGEAIVPNRLLEGSDGFLYGTSQFGGVTNATSPYGLGTVFKLGKDGSGYAVLRSFLGPADKDGSYASTLVEANDGVLYGLTYNGGSADQGTVFRLQKDGSGYAVLWSFTGVSRYTTGPRALMEGRDGGLYGATDRGGLTNATSPDGMGTIFKLNRDGSGYELLHKFSGFTNEDGSGPTMAFVEGTDGSLYGTTWGGGASNAGTVFKLNKDGSRYMVLHSFSYVDGDGARPNALMEARDGMLYGTAWEGGAFGLGTLFKLNRDGTGYAGLHNFDWNAGEPYIVIEGIEGALYGATVDGRTGGTLFKLSPDGGDYNILLPFFGPRHPGARLAEAADGRFLYGVTAAGGTFDAGTVFELSKESGSLQVLHSFGAEQPVTLALPKALVVGTDGMLYGTTERGGSYGLGSVFKLKIDGSGYRILRSFSEVDGGGYPELLLEASDGLLYGTASGDGEGGAGAIFRIAKDGSGFGVLHTFGQFPEDGVFPHALVETRDGDLYGVTGSGGCPPRGCCCGGRGTTVFRLSKDGSNYCILAATNVPPLPTGLYEGNDGLIYGTTGGIVYAGAQSGMDFVAPGTLFRMNKDGSNFAVVFELDGFFSLTLGRDGIFYGTAVFLGSDAGDGAIIKVNRDGSGYAVLQLFNRQNTNVWFAENSLPHLLAATDGRLYGTTVQGGSSDVGTIFALGPVSWLAIAADRSLSLSSAPGLRFRIEYVDAIQPTNQWQTLTNLTLNAIPILFSDPGAASVPHRFYRALHLR